MCSLEVWLKSHVLFCWFIGLIYMNHVWFGARKCRLRGQVSPCWRIGLFYYAFGFPLSWTANCFSAEPEPWIGFLDKPFIGGWKLHFLWRDLPFLPNFVLICTKSAKNMEKECSYLKINAYLDSPHSYTAMDTNLFSLFERKSFSRWKLLHSRSFGHVTLKLWVDLPWGLNFIDGCSMPTSDNLCNVIIPPTIAVRIGVFYCDTLFTRTRLCPKSRLIHFFSSGIASPWLVSCWQLTHGGPAKREQLQCRQCSLSLVYLRSLLHEFFSILLQVRSCLSSVRKRL